MGQSEEDLLDYEEDQLDRAKKGLPAEDVNSAATQLADVTLKSKSPTKDAAMNDSTIPGEETKSLN
ncbi:hypothetical protein AAVH_13373 [Aphelenchoides avenae]|nr:hypothetical protein AAVH_13373 [Aphelenchus avenae]